MRLNSFPCSAWECMPGRSASPGLRQAARTTRSVKEGIPTRSVGTRECRLNLGNVTECHSLARGNSTIGSGKEPQADGRVEIEHAAAMTDQGVTETARRLGLIVEVAQVIVGTDLAGGVLLGVSSRRPCELAAGSSSRSAPEPRASCGTHVRPVEPRTRRAARVRSARSGSDASCCGHGRYCPGCGCRWARGTVKAITHDRALLSLEGLLS